MGDQISKITNGQIDRKMKESRCAVNSMGITFPYSFASKWAKLNWYDISFAIDYRFLSHQSAVEHALTQLEQNDACAQVVLDLACLFENEITSPYSIQPYISKLESTVEEQEKKLTQHKMLYLLMKWVLDHQADYADPLRVVEIIYADFGHPQIIAGIVRYMPMTERDLGTVALNEARLFANWGKYLDEQERRFSR